jgi:hypothetical protein
MTIGYVFVINDGGGDSAKSVATFHVFEKSSLEFLGVAANDTVRVLTKDLHLTLVALAHAVALETILVSALFLTHLTVPTKLLETLCFYSISNSLWCQKIVLPHSSFLLRFTTSILRPRK